MQKAHVFLPLLALGAWIVPACGGRVLEDEPRADAEVPPIVVVDAGRDATLVDAREPERDASEPGVDGGPVQPLEIIEITNITPGEALPFIIPARALGFHVMVQSDRPSETLAVAQITAPDGEVVHSNATPAGGSHPTSETLFGLTAAAQVPQGEHPSSLPGVMGGQWTVTFRGEGRLRAKIQVQTTPDGLFHGGALDVNVYIPSGIRLGGGSAITIANAPTSPEVRGRLTSFFDATLDLYGLSRGNVRFHGISGRYANLDDNDLADVFQESRVAPAGQGLHVVLSDGDDASEWWGIAMGIPGAANAPGNEQSGVALASVDGADADIEGFVLAHEAGHFFGLNHTTELSGDPDPLSDTPVCTNISVGDLESCPDVGNIMFVAGAIFSPSTSASQRRVVQGSPIFRAFQSGTPPLPRGVRRAPDWGKLFGHPGVRPNRGELLALAGTCRHGSHRPKVVSAADTAALEAVARDTHVAKRLRHAAARLLAPR